MQQFLDPSPRINLITTWCILAGIRWEGIFLDGNFSGVNYPWWKFSGCQLSWAGISRVAVILGGYFPGGNCLGENYYQGGSFMLQVLSIIIFFQFFLFFFFDFIFIFYFYFYFHFHFFLYTYFVFIFIYLIFHDGARPYLDFRFRIKFCWFPLKGFIKSHLNV